MACVVIENLTKTFQGPKREVTSAVNNLSITIEDREFLVLVGPSGCGKTTTLRLIAGLEEITSGTISIDGAVVNSVAPKDRDVAMVFQNLALYPHMTAYDNMAFGLQVRKLNKKEIEQRVHEAAELLDLKDCLGRLPEHLSGGQRQRVALGRAIVRKPKVFLFDEPLASLDAPLRIQLRKELRRLHSRLASTMIFVTHDQSEAMALGDRIAVMKGGVLQQVGTPAEIYNRPANLFAAGFIGSSAMNIFNGTLVSKSGEMVFESSQKQNGEFLSLSVPKSLEAVLNNHIGKTVSLGIRPEHIHTAGTSTEWIVEAVAELLEHMGAECHLNARIGNDSFMARIPGVNEAKTGQKVWLSFDMHQAHFFDRETGLRIA